MELMEWVCLAVIAIGVGAIWRVLCNKTRTLEEKIAKLTHGDRDKLKGLIDEHVVVLKAEMHKAHQGFQDQLTALDDQLDNHVGEQRSELVKIAKKEADERSKLLKQQHLEFEKMIDESAAKFKYLLDTAYLKEYEKMRLNPPRPKKGPRNKVSPPSKYRSLDDE